MSTLKRWFALILLCLAPLLAHAEPPPVAIGFYMPLVRDVPRKDVEVTLRFWVEELANSIGLTYEPIRFYDDLDDLKHDLRAGKINYVLGTGMGLAQHFTDDELADGFGGAKTTPEHLLLVVRRDAGIKTVKDLGGKSIHLLDRDELSEIYLETLLMKGGLTTGQLKYLHKQKNTRTLALKLFFDQGDAALIPLNAFEIAVALNPQIGERLTVLDDYTFKGRVANIGLFSSKVSPADRETITAAAMKLDRSPRGRQLLDIYQTDKMTRTYVTDLLPYRELLATHDRLAGKSPSRGQKAGNE